MEDLIVTGLKKMIIFIICVILLIGVIIGVKYLKAVNNYKKTTEQLNIKSVNLSEVKDGSYIGSYDAQFVAAKVEVKIKNHKIASIKLLEHKNGRGKKAEIIPKKVVKSQTLKVDTVSGATISSKVILKAIENALERGIN